MKRFIIEQRPSTRIRRVLVVDDDLDMVLSLTTLLRIMGHEATGVTRAAGALDAALPDSMHTGSSLPIHH